MSLLVGAVVLVWCLIVGLLGYYVWSVHREKSNVSVVEIRRRFIQSDRKE